MNLAAARQLDSMQAIESRQEGMWVIYDVLVIVAQYTPQKLVFRVRNRLYDEPIVAVKVEKRPRLAGRPQFREDILCRERQEIVGWVEVKVLLAQVSKYPWRIVFEFKIVACRGRQFIADSTSATLDFSSHVKRVLVSRRVILLGHCPLDLCLAP